MGFFPMKNLILTLMLSAAMLATSPAFAMLAKESHERTASKPISQKREFIEFHDEDVEYYTGSNLRYYGEYRPKQMGKNFISFPLSACDPLPIHQCGSLKFFFISAITGNCPCTGDPIVLPEPLTEVRAVRAKANSNGQWTQVYFGYDSNQYNMIGNKKVYQAQLLVLRTKDTRNVQNRTYRCFSGAEYLSNMLVAKEVKIHLENSQDWNWNSPVFQSVLADLLPIGEGMFWSSQCLWSNVVYWTQDENKLKKIKYRKR